MTSSKLEVMIHATDLMYTLIHFFPLTGGNKHFDHAYDYLQMYIHLQCKQILSSWYDFSSKGLTGIHTYFFLFYRK